ncbi:MAG: hypothetical protein ACI4GY_04755 [Acutalibacteraceae bacterium]
MFKKAISILLSVVMIFSFAVLPASAAESDEANEKITVAVNLALSALTAEDDEVIYSDEALTEKIIEENGADVTVSELSKELSSLVLVKESELSSADKAKAIADDSSYHVVTLSSGKKTVYIAVDLAAHPELFDIEVFHDAVIALVDKQNEYIEGEENVSLLDYNRLAGELALHMIIYKAAEPFYGKIDSALINFLYENAVISEINIDEMRVPGPVFTFIGLLIMQIFYRLRNVM